MRLKVRGVILSVILFIIIVIALSCLTYFSLKDKTKNADVDEYTKTTQREVETKPKKKNHLTKDNITDDLRLHYYNNIKLPSTISIGDYIDIRISYGNGMDFIILPKKQVLDVSISDNTTESSIWLEVSEEEILRMSSAFVDLNTYEGSLIYGIKYLSETQKIAKANYPVNEDVRTLINSDPNIINKGIHLIESKYRKVIEDLYCLPDTLIEDTQTWGEDSVNPTNINDEDITYLD